MADRANTPIKRAVGPDRALVAFQVMLEGAILLGAPLEFFLVGVGFRLIIGWVNVLIGLSLVLGGLFVASAARRELAANFTASPTPVPGGDLVESGVYARMRHPIYFGIIVLSLGWAIIWGSWFGLAGTFIMTALLAYKARREERLLMRRYAGYAAYCGRVRGGIMPRP